MTGDQGVAVWQIPGLTVGVVAILVRVAIYWKQRRRKLLSYRVLSRSPLLSPQAQAAANLQVLVGGQQARNVDLVVVKIVNPGNEEIRPEDFEQPLVLSMAESATILGAELAETRPPNRAVSITYDETCITVPGLLMNSGDWITMSILLKDYSGSLSVSGHIAGVKEIGEMREKPWSAVTLILAGAVAFGLWAALPWFNIFRLIGIEPRLANGQDLVFMGLIFVGTLLPILTFLMYPGLRQMLTSILVKAV